MTANRTLPWQFLIATFVLGLLASPAKADYAAAVAAYEKGAYEEAYREFNRLTENGDEEAQRYLDEMRKRGMTFSIEEVTVSKQLPKKRVFGTRRPPMHRASRETYSWNRDPTDTMFDLELRKFVQRRVEPAETEIVIPYHASVWSRIFHLPADATMIGLQYMDVLLDADARYSDLRYIIGHGNAITLGVMAAIWWFIIFRVLYDISAFLLALIRAAFRPLEDKPYG